MTVINDILDLSKVEAGKMTLAVTSCDLVGLLAEVAGLMRVRAEHRGDQLHVEFQGKVPASIHTDPDRLRQSLVNLIGNAIKFTENGEVRIVVRLLEDYRDGESAVRLDVIDTGIGIPTGKLERVFQPFAQVDVSTSRRYGGTGLGLSITRHIARLLGGELSASSIVGEGSTFRLTIPTGDLTGVERIEVVGEALSKIPAALEPYRGKALQGMRVLLVEDGPDNQILIQAFLCKEGAEVEIAANGLVAVERARGRAFDVVLMDMQMPEMDGYEATRVLREQGFAKPIIALTAHAMSGDREKCLAAGCDDYLTKPVTRNVLTDAILQNLGEPLASVQAQDGAAAQITDTNDDPRLRKLRRQFIDGLSDRLARMQLAREHLDHETLRNVAHQLKGAGAGYGCPEITSASRNVEEAAKAEDTERETLRLAELAQVCDELRQQSEDVERERKDRSSSI